MSRDTGGTILFKRGGQLECYHFMSASDATAVEMLNILKDNNENSTTFTHFLWIIDLIF